jgi:hypothetical protein
LARTNNLGANGIKVHDGAVWVSNTDNGTWIPQLIGSLVHIPVRQRRSGVSGVL